MNKTKKITTITLWVNRVIALAVVALLFTLQPLMDWYCNFRELTDADMTVITVAFYFCAVAIFIALWNIEKLLGRLLSGQVFIPENISGIRRIQWCSGFVSIACFGACFAYLPLVFLGIIMAFVCLAVGVAACVMDAAVTIREENDLTI